MAKVSKDLSAQHEKEEASQVKLTFLVYRLIKNFFYTLNWINSPPPLKRDRATEVIPADYKEKVVALLPNDISASLIESFKAAAEKERLSLAEKYYEEEYKSEALVDKATALKVKKYIDENEKSLLLDPIDSVLADLEIKITAAKAEREKKAAERKLSRSPKSRERKASKSRTKKSASDLQSDSTDKEIEDEFSALMKRFVARASTIHFKRGDLELYSEL